MATHHARTRKSLIPSYTWVFYGKVVTEVLQLDPLKTEYKNIKKHFKDKAEVAKAMDHVRKQIKTTLARPVHKVFDVVLTTEQKERLLLISEQPVTNISVNFYETVEEKGASGLTWMFGLLKSDESSESIMEDEVSPPIPVLTPLFTFLPLSLTPRYFRSLITSSIPAIPCSVPFGVEHVVDKAAKPAPHNFAAPSHRRAACFNLTFILN
ncbi:hypothetical protein B0H13DRAFT_1883700 [Mycena leptocephala]|nr:hypothetical protein B0H13DRAFT_1883700 [Mycena leptocephala]